jgi:hypothetical protein
METDIGGKGNDTLLVETGIARPIIIKNVIKKNKN